MFKRVAFVGTDKAFFTFAKKNLLGFCPDVSWLEFDNGYEIINYCLNSKELPEIVFTEMLLLKIDGIIVTDYLTTYFPYIGVICVTDELDNQIIKNVAEVGALGLINKSAPTMLLKFINTNDDICSIIKTSVKNICPINAATPKGLFHYRYTIFKKYRITKRESLFLLLNATGLEYGEIAALMFISRKTVENMFNSVAKKFGVQNRHNLTLVCIRMRLTKFSIINTYKAQNLIHH